MNSFFNVLPPELQSAPALVAGFLALLGLILWTAGVQVAKPLAAAFAGATAAATAACVLPAMTSLNALTAAVIGLAFGLLVGALAFKLVQGLILAACLSVLASGAFYQWQASVHPWPPSKTGVAVVNPATPAGHAVAALPVFAQSIVQRTVARLGGTPGTLRQSMVVIAAGVAILAIFVAWLLPRQTTWLMSAAGGMALLLYGGTVLLGAYVPAYQQYVPSDVVTRLAIVAALVVIGMVVQRLYFWPGKREKQEKAKDHGGEVAPA